MLDDSNHALSNKFIGLEFNKQCLGFLLSTQYPAQDMVLSVFESRKKYPAWAKKNNWEFRLKYLNQNDKRFPPGYNMYLRILSEI